MPTNQNQIHLIISYICGFLAVLVSPVSYTIIALIQPNYNMLNQSISALGSPGAPFATYISINFILSGIFEMIFASGLYPALGHTKGALWGAILIGCSGFFNSTCSGLFPLDTGISGTIHDIVSIVGEIAMIIAPLVLIPTLKPHSDWNIIRIITIIVELAFIVMICLTIILFLTYNNADVGQGFTQRIGDYAYYFWIFCMAIRMCQLCKKSI
jgi:hypothetical membrane protein